MSNRKPWPNLHEKLKAKLKTDGPISVYTYMKACLYDETFGVYRTTNPIGANAHFTTAPEISQLFGEIISIWIYSRLQKLSKDKTVHLVELGPGRGTLMQDIIRSLSRFSLDDTNLSITMVERSAPLKQEQNKRLANTPWPINWVEDIGQGFKGTSLFIANEFFDCFPVRQFINHENQWVERLVMLDSNDELNYGIAPAPLSAQDLDSLSFSLPTNAANGALYETMPDMAAFTNQLKQLIGDHSCHGLFIDYGNLDPCFGDTLQALHQHQKCSPFDHMGDTDLTAHVNFTQLGQHLTNAGFICQPLMTQQDFLLSHGIELRAGALLKQATQSQRTTIQQGLHRLIDSAQMGSLFKCLTFSTS